MKTILVKLSVAASTGALITLLALMLTGAAQPPNMACTGNVPGCHNGSTACQSCYPPQGPAPWECSLLLPPTGETWVSYRWTQVPYFTCVTGTAGCEQTKAKCKNVKLFSQPNCGGPNCTASDPQDYYAGGCTLPAPPP